MFDFKAREAHLISKFIEWSALTSHLRLTSYLSDSNEVLANIKESVQIAKEAVSQDLDDGRSWCKLPFTFNVFILVIAWLCGDKERMSQFMYVEDPPHHSTHDTPLHYSALLDILFTIQR